MRLLICSLLCLISVAAGAKPYLIKSDTSISNGNWYPLTVQEMKAATVDAALSELTANGQFEIVQDNSRSPAGNDGNIRFDISLIGPAEVVKLTTTLQLNGSATYVSSVAMNIHGLDYRGIYGAFEYVGAEAAKRLNAKISMQKNPGVNTGSQRPASVILTLFDQAQQRKRSGQGREARALFEKVIETSTAADIEWKNMAVDELRYGLPIFEADSLLLENKSMDPALSRKKIETVAHLYRQILADNTDNAQRVAEMNKRLDNIAVGAKALSSAMQANSLSRASSLRPIMQDFFMSEGQWPDVETLKKEIPSWLPGFDLVSYQPRNEQFELVVRDKEYGGDIQLNGSPRGIALKMK